MELASSLLGLARWTPKHCKLLSNELILILSGEGFP